MSRTNGQDEHPADWPTFVRELEGTLAVHAQYVLHGNIRDLHLIPGEAKPVPLADVLWAALRRSGYGCLIRYDPVEGITAHPGGGPEAAAAADRVLGPKVIGTTPSREPLRTHLAAVAEPRAVVGDTRLPDGRTAGARRPRAAMLIDYASRMVRAPGTLDEEERDFFLFCQKLANRAEPIAADHEARPWALYNPIIWLVEGERDLPAWLTAGSERIRTIGVPLPGLPERDAVARLLVRGFGVTELPAGSPERRLVDRFVQLTDGMTLHAMREITRLAKDRRLGFDRLPDAVRIYKLGVSDNPWGGELIWEKIAAAAGITGAGSAGADGRASQPSVPASSGTAPHAGEQNGTAGRAETTSRLGEKVLGQTAAVDKTLDILMRAALGLSGAQATSSGSRPRGVLFFAGPTGVGKTELAKSVAELLFGDTESYLRFDMSEFSAAHAADRLVGAPPGYVGFEAGGELTSEIRRKPFRVVLFDEIEKAHPSVLDKFLQILEDGRLTDGQGVTTYFSECVLIFTSNLGIIETDPKTQQKKQKVTADMNLSYEELEEVILGGIRHDFTHRLGRPELLNRFGDNIVVFDFISPETAGRIFDLQLENITRRVSEQRQISVRIDPAVRAELRRECTKDRDNGGRGIGNALESAFVNPLARELFQRRLPAGSTVRVTGIALGGERVSLTLQDLTAVGTAR